MKKIFEFLLVLMFFVSLINVFSLNSRVFAAEPVTISACEVTKKAYEPSESFFNLDIRRTVNNMLIGSIISLYTNASGVDPDATMSCQWYILEKLNDSDLQSRIAPPETLCAGEITEGEKEKMRPVCEALVSDLGNSTTTADVGGRTASIYKDSINSSMIGLATSLEGVARKEPLPVNLAYYWNQSVTKIPFAGRALAATSGEAYKNLPVIKAVYSIWSVFLKVSLGILSIVLLYTGIMITMGRKLSNQLVVSVQYAIPKIVIGTILMIFSYPIGAVITSISFGLFRGATPIVSNLLMNGTANDSPSGLLSMAMAIQTLSMARGGGFYLVVCFIMLVILTIGRWIIYLKVLMVYIKMAFSIVSAPLEFVLGTIPGNDDKIKDWFMRMLKYGLTIFAMGLIIPLTYWVGLEIMAAYISGDATGGEVGGWGVVISLIAPLLIVVFGIGMGIGMESRIDGFLSGGKKKK